MLFRDINILDCVLLHFILPFYAFVENFTSYVTLYLYACWCHGLRLLDLNKETTYLLTYFYVASKFLRKFSLARQESRCGRRACFADVTFFLF